MLHTIAVIGAVLAMSSGTAYAQQCLHGPDETAEEAARRKDALAVTRLVNTAQVNSPGARNGVFFHQFELASAPYMVKNRESALIKRISLDPNQEILPGWKLTLDVAREGYWFMVKDVKDPCGFAYISNQAGVIYTAQPLR